VFLVFLVPFPVVVTQGIEMFFQHTSSTAAHVMFLLSGTPVYRDGTYFQLPGLAIRVAEECSGIRSSLVLFITSLLAGYMFLRSPWRRAVLAFAVIPLAIVRNGFRVFTVSMLTMHVDPNAIHGPIHHQGGPLFFALSLVPFFLLLLWLRKSERKRETPIASDASEIGGTGRET
jgi:exosortase C (VPDSG-CTERM-specific)